MHATNSGCRGLTSVTIPNSVTSIGDYVFSGCSNVKELIYADGCTTAFKTYLTSITSVTIPNSVTSIGSNAFYDCSSLTSITIPNSVTSIGSYAFSGCSSLTSLTIPNSVTSIGSGAFRYCNNVKELIYADGCTTALRTYLTNITSLTIPTSVTSIGESAFYGCSKLSRIDIPASVTSIGASAFSGCAPTAFICRGTTPPSMGTGNKFDGSKRIIVPFASVNTYKSSWTALSESNGYAYLPLLDVMFFENTDASKYVSELSGKDKASITSVAFYDGGLASDLTYSKLTEGMNPNCLYYVPSSSSLVGNNIVRLDDYNAARVVLTDGYTYNCPIPFHASEIEYQHTPKVWADGRSGWETICLPFAPTDYRASTSGILFPITLGGRGNFWLRRYVGSSSSSVYFTSTSDGEMEAQTPYLVAFPGEKLGSGHLQGQTITFSASNINIGVTEVPTQRKNDFTFVGNYNTEEDGVTGWELNANGSCFVESSKVGKTPFSAYFTNINGNNGANMLKIDFGTFDETTGIFTPEDNMGGAVDCDGTMYDMSGRKVSDGETPLKSGVYVKGNKKVLVR